MNTRIEPAPGSRYLADTHEVSNLSSELCDYNMYTEDAALREAVYREGGQWAERELTDFGKMTGSADYLELGQLANKFTPEFDTHDRFGKRGLLGGEIGACHEHRCHSRPGPIARRQPGLEPRLVNEVADKIYGRSEAELMRRGPAAPNRRKHGSVRTQEQHVGLRVATVDGDDHVVPCHANAGRYRRLASRRSPSSCSARLL